MRVPPDLRALESAILRVLCGADPSKTAEQVRIDPWLLRGAVARYRSAGREAIGDYLDWSHWWQVRLRMPTTGAAELALARGLGPWLMEAEAGGTLSAWFFTRKRQQWRIRYLPTRCGASQIKAAFTPPLTALRANGHLDGWYEQRYEAELLPFGGAEGMELAHRLFHRDSRALFAYLRALADGVLVDRRREVSTLLSLALLSGAGLDWYERGDVWARVARHRPVPRDGDQHRQLIEPGLRVLLRSDLEQATTGGLMPAGAADWVTSFRETGAMLAELADTGKLRRGLRAVLAHHLLFHFNRAGISGRTQGAIAAIAMEVTFE